MCTGSVRPLEDAFRIGQADLVPRANAMDTLDAYQLVSQLGLAPAANVCAPNCTMLAKLPKWSPKSTEAHGGVHRRLRAAAEDYKVR
jgi:hypothetical protein